MPKSIQLSSHPISAALRAAPPIPGLFFDPSVQLPAKLADQVAEFCMGQYFDEGNGGRRVNQIMLFERANDNSSSINAGEISPSPASSTGLPPPLLALLDTLSDLLNPKLPIQIHKLLFPSSHTQSSDSQASLQARQAILNLYAPGEGISPHVDLLRRFGDGIIGDSSVDIASRSDSDTYDVYLPRNSIIILTGDARYKWTHGIERRDGDWVSSSEKEGARKMDWIPRSTRLSITFRWLLPGADVVGGNAP
ncbi:hypothetical protein GYMLUDRAFT_160914 [Collybiopsis luxurians FD-317 M1]|nr:hypothetical protein GYMLUDRAFT_160914 [Collybiopsis luxurians FD-317 M1]